MNTVTTEFEEITQLIGDIPIPCEGRQHSRGIFGHVPEAQGEFYIVNPCGERVVQCRGRIAYMFHVSFDVGCVTCGKTHPITSFIIEPLKR
jgi:hypothetical protein